MPVGRRVLSTNSDAVYFRELARKYREQGLCRCGQLLSIESKSRCAECIERDRKSYRELRKTVIEHYGGQCNCCGEREPKFLALDHKEGNGNQHRLLVTGHKRGSIYRWIVRNNFPPDFQVHCHNCNMAKGLYGACPHKAGI